MTLSRNRFFNRTEPDRDAKSIYIFCEGKDREYKYFSYFKNIDSRLNLVVYELKSDDNNSPKGLYNLAIKNLIKSEDNPNPQYELLEEDEVWIVLDTDKDKTESRKPQLITIRQECVSQNWNIAQSNPCFEVWLYYHQENENPNFDGIEISAKWKSFVDSIIRGGFNPNKHPVYIQKAVENAQTNFKKDRDGFPDIAATEVYKLAQAMLSIGNIKNIIESKLHGKD